MLKDNGIHWVIIGHSERRHVYGESNALISNKISKAIGSGLSVIACIGEKIEEREKNETFKVCFEQLEAIKKI